MAPAKPAPGILKLIRPDILAMLGYEPIEPAELLAERLGLPADQLAKLDGNENPFGPSPRVIEALANFGAYERYGDPQQRALREALSAYTGVGAEHIVAGHGSDEIIDLLLRAIIQAGDHVIDCPPTFGMYGFSTRVCGGSIIEVPRGEGFSVDTDAVRAATRAASAARAVFVPSPNNPTGNPLTRAELDALLETGLLIVVDEAYIEFGGESAAALVPERENLVVLRTFSKWAGLAGLRAGYGIMPPALADVLMRIKPPYTPNAAAEVAMQASLEDKDALMSNVRAIVKERDRMSTMLGSIEPLEVYPSAANFVLVRAPGRRGQDLRDALARRGIFVRYFDSPRLQDCLRISVGRPQDTDRAVAALREEVA